VTGPLVVDAVVRREAFHLELAVRVEPGEVLAVLGPNGAGKSTLLAAIAGLVALESGRIEFAGTVVDDVDADVFLPPARRSAGVVFQDYRLFPHLSVADNIAFGPRSRGRDRHDSARVAAGWSERLGLTDLVRRRPGDLSGGQAQRVALARALATDPDVLLLDEPLAALDARTRIHVQSELRTHLREYAGPCVVVTHDPLDALLLADRLLILEAGRVVQVGTPLEVTRRPATEYVARLVGLNLYAGRVDRAGIALDGGGTFVVPENGEQGEVLVSVRPSSVVVSAAPPAGGSARNCWPARVVGLDAIGDRVRLDLAGEPAAAVDVTAAAVVELGLRPGSEVWLSVKATDLEVYPRTG
jgi:molybdate transport system ATP-binding protein